MRFRRLTSALLFVLAGSLFGTASVAWAAPKEDVAAATLKWAQTFAQCLRVFFVECHMTHSTEARSLRRDSKTAIAIATISPIFSSG
jgi:hypothetical protein